MAERPQNSISKLVEKETEQQRVERVRAEERKRHAATTTDILKARNGIAEE